MAFDVEVSQGRSPRYPRFALMTAVSYAARLYDGAHRSTTDTLTAYKVMGFAGKSGASATALGAARQFGLVESSKGGVRVSDLGLRVLEPSSEDERIEALHEAAYKPHVFDQIFANFEELPRSDEPIRSFLIRSLDFSKSGADDCIAALRETIAQLPEIATKSIPSVEEHVGSAVSNEPPIVNEGRTTTEASNQSEGQLVRIPLSRDCTAEIRFSTTPSSILLDRLISHIELMKDVWAAD